jgi:hypothetical protein
MPCAIFFGCHQVVNITPSFMNHIINKRRPDDKLQKQQNIHLLKSFMGEHRFAHGHKLEVMNDMFYMWIEKQNHKRVIRNDLHLRPLHIQTKGGHGLQPLGDGLDANSNKV